jgi:hypothetical protein
MAVNASKTKFIVFRTHGKKIESNDCKLFLNSNEPGLPEDPSLILEIERNTVKSPNFVTLLV